MRELQVVMRVRTIDIAAAISILLHVMLFTLTPRKPAIDPLGPVSTAPLNVVLAPPQAEPAPVLAPDAPVQPAQPAAVPTPTPRPPAPVITRRPTPLPPRFPAPPSLPPPMTAPKAPVPAPTPAPPAVDMMAAIEARRAERAAADAALARGAPAAPASDAATRNLETLSGREGVGGVFQVLRKGLRTGEFAFNGFRGEGRRQWREVIEVDAGVGGDVELAMVRRMIELIRTHYSGDFLWESHRLGRTVTLSARLPDQPGLEDFLVKEFFGTPPVNPRRR
jgi:hypothetical protein